MLVESAPAKVNLLLHVGPARADGLHALCSLFASIDLADELQVEPAPPGAGDRVDCPGVEGPNLAGAAIACLRESAAPDLPPLHLSITKKIPVAAGLAGGSADAAAALRAANALAGGPLDPDGLRRLGARLGADVPSQIEPAHALVTGAGEQVEPIRLPPMSLVLIPQQRGLGAGEVYAEADRIGAGRARLDPVRVRALAAEPLETLAPRLENDLEAAARSLRPELAEPLAALKARGALTSLVTGSGPTVFGVFADRAGAEEAARALPGALVADLRGF